MVQGWTCVSWTRSGRFFGSTAPHASPSSNPVPRSSLLLLTFTFTCLKMRSRSNCHTATKTVNSIVNVCLPWNKSLKITWIIIIVESLESKLVWAFIDLEKITMRWSRRVCPQRHRWVGGYELVRYCSVGTGLCSAGSCPWVC